MLKIKSILSAIRRNHIRKCTFTALSRLDDKQLRDLGYERQNLWPTIQSMY